MVVRDPGAPDHLRLEDVPMPSLRANDVRIRVEACGVCFHDVVTRNGVMKRGVRMPLIPGHEVSGVVESVGPAVRLFKPRNSRSSQEVSRPLRQNRHQPQICRRCAVQTRSPGLKSRTAGPTDSTTPETS